VFKLMLAVCPYEAAVYGVVDLYRHRALTSVACVSASCDF